MPPKYKKYTREILIMEGIDVIFFLLISVHYIFLKIAIISLIVTVVFAWIVDNLEALMAGIPIYIGIGIIIGVFLYNPYLIFIGIIFGAPFIAAGFIIIETSNK